MGIFNCLIVGQGRGAPKYPPPPQKTRNFLGMEVFLQKERNFSAHKIGAAISGPRIAGKMFHGHEDFIE